MKTTLKWLATTFATRRRRRHQRCHPERRRCIWHRINTCIINVHCLSILPLCSDWDIKKLKKLGPNCSVKTCQRCGLPAWWAPARAGAPIIPSMTGVVRLVAVACSNIAGIKLETNGKYWTWCHSQMWVVICLQQSLCGMETLMFPSTKW